MSSISICVVTNTYTSHSSEKESKLKLLSIPFKVSNNKIYLIDNKDVYFSTSDLKGNNFLLDLLSDNPKYNLNGDFSNITTDIQRVLIDVFEEIQLDISFTDSNSGQSNWLDFRISSDFEFDYIFEDDEDDDW